MGVLNEKKCKIFDKIFINNIGLPIENIYGKNFEVHNDSDNINLFEIPTINKLFDFSVNCQEDTYICYLHSKGITHGDSNQNVNDWIDLLIYFNIYKY